MSLDKYGDYISQEHQQYLQLQRLEERLEKLSEDLKGLERKVLELHSLFGDLERNIVEGVDKKCSLCRHFSKSWIHVNDDIQDRYYCTQCYQSLLPGGKNEN